MLGFQFYVKIVLNVQCVKGNTAVLAFVIGKKIHSFGHVTRCEFHVNMKVKADIKHGCLLHYRDWLSTDFICLIIVLFSVIFSVRTHHFFLPQGESTRSFITLF